MRPSPPGSENCMAPTANDSSLARHTPQRPSGLNLRQRPQTKAGMRRDIFFAAYYTMRAHTQLIGIVQSHLRDKKWDAVFENMLTGHRWAVPFGAEGYSDFTEHKDPVRKLAYLARHWPRERWDNPFSPGSLARYILWDEPTLEASIESYRRRFNL